jgi:hypothetical protein
MPNHVINEVIFHGDSEFRRKVRRFAINANGEIDFTLMLPIPLYCWQGGVSSLHQKRFPDNALYWCAKHWGTKWGAYGQKPIEETEDSLILRFDTAWNAPFGWLAAMFNALQVGFEVNWFSEGESRGHSAKFDMGDKWGMQYTELAEISDDMQKHLHLLRWGVESFPEEEEETEPE